MGRGEGGKIGRDSGVRKSATGGGGGGTNETQTDRDRERQRQKETETDTQRGRETQRETETEGREWETDRWSYEDDPTRFRVNDVTKQKLHKHSVRYLFLLVKPLLDGKMVGTGDSFPITAEILTEKFSCNNSITIFFFFFGVGGRGGLSAKLPKFVKLP